jgi:hypothetical protein
MPPEIPEKKGDRVLSFVQESSDLNFIIVGAVGHRPTLEPPFPHNEASVDIEPVFRVSRHS